MLFNSFTFLLVFLPFTLFLFYGCRKLGQNKLAIGSLVAASFIFYGYWNPSHLSILAGSIVVNYFIGRQLSRLQKQTYKKALLLASITANLLLLGYFKYTNFILDNINEALDWSTPAQTIILPLAISFFTFQQIAYLVDNYRHHITASNFLDYCLFVSFFPQLIAGPIVHHKEMMPQFSALPPLRQTSFHISLGLTLFSLGLFKKTVIADNFAIYANHVFNASETLSLSTADAWIGAFSYHFQIYFDFSGYSDMAIGLACMFGIMLPINFDSPYKSLSIIDFWRKWHMTLSRFLRDYLYITLGGNRNGKIRRHANLLITMLLGGLWHGAAWTFVVWGGLHGVYLIMNHGLRSLLGKLQLSWLQELKLYRIAALALTTLCVIIAWVYFRASDLASANTIIMAMFSDQTTAVSQELGHILQTQSFALLPGQLSDHNFAAGTIATVAIILAQALILLAPNSMQLLSRWQQPQTQTYQHLWEIAGGIMLCCSIISMFGVSEFIYFQF